MKIKNWRILVMVGWILFFAHVMVWSVVLIFTSAPTYVGDNHSLGAVFSYLTDHETFVKVNIISATFLLVVTLFVIIAGRRRNRVRWSRRDFAIATTMIVTATISFLTYLVLCLYIHDINRQYDGPLLGAQVYEIKGVEDDRFVELFDSIRNSRWEYTHYHNQTGVVITIVNDKNGCEDNVEWRGRHHFCNIRIPKGNYEIIVNVYRNTNTQPLEITINGKSGHMPLADIAEFEDITLNKICTYDRCEKRRHKESFYSYMTREESHLLIGFIGFSIIASLIVLLNLKASRDKYLPPPFNPT